MEKLLQRLAEFFAPRIKVHIEQKKWLENVNSGAPSLLSKFSFDLHTQSARPVSKVFRLICPKCSGTHFEILCFSETSDDTRGKAEYCPHDLKCKACTYRALLFDIRKHGYEGALGEPPTYGVGSGESAPAACDFDSYEVFVELIYNIEMGELEEIAKESNTKSADLFDFIEISGKTADGKSAVCFSYECS